MCYLECGFHWYYERKSNMYMIAKSPEEAEHKIRSYVSRKLRSSDDMLIKSEMAKILASRLFSVLMCEKD